MITNISTPTVLTFSGHETFVLRGNWLKKAYDLLQETPNLFSLQDAFVYLGVGKNMAQSIKYWGRACGIFERTEDNDYKATWLGHALFNDSTGWDPYLVSPASQWLLHWYITTHADTAFTWYYTFNLLRRGEFTASQLEQHIQQFVQQKGQRLPSQTTLQRDIDCMIRCYIRPSFRQIPNNYEDMLQCPLHNLGLFQQSAENNFYHLVQGDKPTLPTELVILAALKQSQYLQRNTISFQELVYGEFSPGRIFRLDEDSLLSKLFDFESFTRGRAIFSDTGGIRQIAWTNIEDHLEVSLLDSMFGQEQRYV
jgi:hypothetical protein